MCYSILVDEAIKIIARQIGKNWKSLARSPTMGFTTTEIDAICYENPRDLKECIHTFFSQWRQKEGSKESVAKLVNGLLEAELGAIADEVSRECLGRQISSRLLHKSKPSSAATSAFPLPAEVERDKTAATADNTSTSNDNVATGVSSPATPTTTTILTSTSPKSPQQTFEVGDMIRIKGKEEEGGGVVKWTGTMEGTRVAGMEMDNKIKGGHDGSWKGTRHFKCPSGHGIYMPFSMIIKDPLFLPDNVPIDLNDLTTGATPGLHRSASDSATNATTTRQPSSETDKPLSERVFDKLLELTADPSDSTDVPGDGVLKVTFPGDRVGLIIGTEGATIHEIQNTTHTTIKISHNRFIPTSNATALIIGSKKNCEDALILMCKKLNEKICRLHAIEETMTVPDALVGRVIGNEGSTKKAIEKLSGAKVKIDQEDKGLALRLLVRDAKIIIKGSKEQIDRAKQLIERAQCGDNIVLLQNVLTEVFQVMKAMGFELS